jgi:hypothetical protein
MAIEIGAGISIGGGILVQPEFPPGAPTVGTATATSATTATVTFTAPSYSGSTAITSYIATSSPGGVTGTLNQSGSGTINVTGLTASTSYTFTVRAINSVGSSSPSTSSNSITTPALVPTVIGEPWGGGYYAGKISTSANGVATHYLIVAPKSTESLGLRWGQYNQPSTSNSDIDGPFNTTLMANVGSEAASYCKNLTTGGYNDWYLPAKNELEVLYYFLKPTTDTNNTAFGSGSNANAVPPEPISTPYTSGSPSQTTASIFQFAQSQAFYPVPGQPNYYYWSSTANFNDLYAWCQQMDRGLQSTIGRNDTSVVTRAVRRIPV